MAFVWYVLAHVGLGLMGYQVFTFTNQGALLCALAGAVIQSWPMWEIHRVAWPRAQAQAAAAGPMQARELRRDYWWRLGRLYLFRTCAFSIITLFVAILARGG